MSELTNKQISEKALETLGKFCVEQKMFDLAGALAVVISASRNGRIKELSWDIAQLGITKEYLDAETRQLAMRVVRK